MTSKEALIELLAMATLTLNKDAVQRLGIIKKDLELLEILKKHYDVNSLTTSSDSFISIYIYKTDKDFEKIKEWLEE